MSETSSDPMILVEMASDLVAAYVSRNSVPVAELPNLIRSIHHSLVNLGSAPEPQADAEPLKPAVPVRKSITDEFIISLEDGRKLKSMKRYLAGLGMTPDEYRTKWGLPKDYPMTAPAYAAKRSALAKTIGLGRKAAQVVADEPQPVAEPDAAALKRKRKAA